MNNVTIEIDGLSELLTNLERIKKVMIALAPTMLEIALRLENDAKDFVTGRKIMSKWQRQAATELGADLVGIKSLGVITWHLRDSITGALEEATEQFISVTVGIKGGSTALVYARIHEFGGMIKTKFARINMPARPYLYAALLKNVEWIKKRVAEEVKRIAKG